MYACICIWKERYRHRKATTKKNKNEEKKKGDHHLYDKPRIGRTKDDRRYTYVQIVSMDHTVQIVSMDHFKGVFF